MIILGNKSDEWLEEMASAIHAERKYRFLKRIGNDELLHDDPSLTRVERIKFVRENNPSLTLTEALWYVEAKSRA